MKNIKPLISGKQLIKCPLSARMVKSCCSIMQNILVHDEFAESVAQTEIMTLITCIIELSCKHLEEYLIHEPKEG
jgi:hypothetical protein